MVGTNHGEELGWLERRNDASTSLSFTRIAVFPN